LDPKASAYFIDAISTEFGCAIIAVSARGLALVHLTGSGAAPTEHAIRKVARHYFPSSLHVMAKDAPRHEASLIQTASRKIIEPLYPNPILLDLGGTPFQQMVWRALKSIPHGEIWSYQRVARAISKPSAYRAVANACGSNRLALIIPCHRVTRSDGALGGYRWGVGLKRRILQSEHKLVSKERLR
jgi:AraC family transcriptional regulator of adaptative response/methylated-DNA-[protein]-cysteine methyltransferase